MEFKYQPLQQKDVPALTQFLDEVFHIKNTDKEALVTWKYFHPFFKNKVIQYGAFEDQYNQLVAHYANLPISVRYKNKTFQSTLCVDMATHPLFRGKGLISALSKLVYQKVEKSGAAFSLGFSNEAGVKVDQNSKGYGYQVVGKFKEYSFILTKQESSEISLGEVLGFSEEVFSSKEASAKNPFFSIEKDVAYLKWRYQQKPHHSYLFFKIMKQDQFLGYVVVKDSNLQLHVLDIITNDTSVIFLTELLKELSNLSLRLGKRIITYSVLENELWNNVMKKSMPFKPVTKKNEFYLTIKTHSHNVMPEKELLNKEKWLCFLGDVL